MLWKWEWIPFGGMVFRKGLGAGGLEHLSSSLSCAGCQFHSVFCLGTFLKPNNHYVFILSVLIHWQNFTFYRFVHFFICMSIYLQVSTSPHVCLVAMKGRSVCQIFWDWNYRQLWGAIWILGTKPVSSAKAASTVLPLSHLYSCKNPFLKDLLWKWDVFRKIQYRKLIARKPRGKEFSNATSSGIIWKCRKTQQVTEDK